MLRKKKITPFDKYFCYVNSVQSAEHDASLILKMHNKSSGIKSDSLLIQEDFCGTADLCYEWVRIDPSFRAVGIDLDQRALAWGQSYHSLGMSLNQTNRVQTICGDVLTPRNLMPNIICALNFSYFFLTDRRDLLNYFRSTLKSLAPNGTLVLDCFGGPEYLQTHSDKRRNSDEKFTYWWEVVSFDAISNAITCRLHYKRDGEAIRRNVFTYHWRLWSVPELTDILKEAGYSAVHYWSEGLSADGSGDGRFKPVIRETNCKSWVCYLVASK